MPFAFLSPLFLLGLLTLAVPVLIHLNRREKSRLVEFPSLMFLSRIPYRSLRRRRIRHWLLLCLRCLALLLLAVAFARPYLADAEAIADDGEDHWDQVLLVDTSFSMGFGDHWQQARAALLDRVSRLRPGDRAALVAFAEEPRVVVQWSGEAANLVAAIETLEPSSAVTRFDPAFKLASQLLRSSEASRRSVLLVSDLQRFGRRDSEGVRLARDVELEIVDLSQAEASNLAVASVLLDRSREGDRERVVVSARIVNNGKATAPEVPVELWVNDRQLAVQSLSVEGAAAATATFEPVVLERDVTTRGSVKIDGDALATDNEYRFALSASQGIPVLVVGRESRDGGKSLYIEQALDLAQVPAFFVTRKTGSAVSAADIESTAVVVINDSLQELTSAAAAALERFVEGGGGVWVALGPAYPSGSPPAVAQRLGVPPATAPERGRDEARRIAFADHAHPLLAIFGKPRSGDFSAARIFRRYSLASSDVYSVLLTFDDGSPALLERRFGEGRVLIWPTTLDTYWNDLALQPVFLPFVHRGIQELAGYAPAQAFYTVGQVVDLSGDLHDLSDELGETWLAILPNGEQQTVDVGQSALLELPAHGFYELRPIGDEGGVAVLTLAANVDVRESDLTPLDAEELESSLLARPDDGQNVVLGSDIASVDGEQERSRLWWAVLLVAAALLGCEALLAHRLSPKVRSESLA